MRFKSIQVYLILMQCNIANNIIAGKYADVFTKDIYNQETVLSQTYPNEETRNKELVAALIGYKRVQVNEMLVKKLQLKVNAINSQQNTRTTSSSWIGAVDVTGKLLSFKWGEALEKVTGTAKELANMAPSEAKVLKHEIDQLEAGIERENVHELEVAYVKQKRFIKSVNPQLCNSIENKFIEARAIDGITTEVYRNFFINALSLPINVKLLVGLDPVCPEKEFLQAFDARPLIQKFSKDTQTELKKILVKLIFLSRDSIGEEEALIRGCYFWGNPGVGKSTAPRELAQTLGLPCFEMTLRGADELTGANLEGSEFWNPQVQIGWLAQALTTKVKSSGQANESSYKNAILVINEFDRTLLGDRIEPLNFLLHYLEPQQKNFRSPYFDCNLDIGKLFFILTGNNPIPHGNNMHKFDALKRRIAEIHFPDFPDATKRSILEEKLEKISRKYYMRETINQQEKARIVRCAMEEGGLGEGAKKIDDLVLALRLKRAQEIIEQPSTYGPIRPNRPTTQSQNHPYT